MMERNFPTGDVQDRTRNALNAEYRTVNVACVPGSAGHIPRNGDLKENMFVGREIC